MARGEDEEGAAPQVDAGGDIEDLARMAADERRFDRGLQFLLDGIEVELARQAAPAAKRRRGR